MAKNKRPRHVSPKDSSDDETRAWNISWTRGSIRKAQTWWVWPSEETAQGADTRCNTKGEN